MPLAGIASLPEDFRTHTTAPTSNLAAMRTEQRVLFVNTRDRLEADVAVHVQLAHGLQQSGSYAAFSLTRTATSYLSRRIAGLPTLPLPSQQPQHSSRRVPPIRLAAALHTMIRYTLTHRIAILHATDRPREAFLAILAAHLTHRAAIIHVHSNIDASSSRISRWSIAHADAVIGVSHFLCRSIEQLSLPARNLTAVHNAVDTDRFHPRRSPEARYDWRSRLGIPPTVFLIGLIGRRIPYKGHADLLAAIAAAGPDLATIHIALVGAPNAAFPGYTQELQKQAQHFDIAQRVHFLDYQHDILPVYQALDLLAVPSWDEPFGLVIIEAMATKLPIVGYASGALPEIITSGRDGILVSRRDIAALRQAITRLLHDPVLA
ncbi:MAG: glycosyltransferase family 4 protein, partial [Chloroflexi bacterium]|nr:glycosyltransferase family 4 protein [Chloroflexota bacterium]